MSDINENNDYNELTLEDIFRIFKKRFWLFFALVVITVVITGIYVFNVIPVYESSVTIKIESSSQSSMSDIFTSSLMGGSSSDISTEIELIKSRTNFEKVAENLNLSERFYTSEEIQEMKSEGKTQDEINRKKEILEKRYKEWYDKEMNDF